MNQETETVVIGAGIIGAAIAYDLQKRGHKITLIDRDAPGSGASFGNMASIAVSEFMPVSRPSVWLQTPGWVLHPEGPIRVAPRYAPKLIPWFLRFFNAGLPWNMRKLEAQGADLCRPALDDMQSLMDEIGLGQDISQTGCLSLYADDAEFRADQERLDMLDRHGFAYEVIESGRLREMEPAISHQIKKAVLLPDNRTVADPHRIVTRLVDIVCERGGIFHQGDVVNLQTSEGTTNIQLSNGEHLKAKNVVICAGAFSARLSKMLGEPIPLETERGYHTQIMAPNVTLDHSIIWPAKAFMVSPTAGGIRIGGTVEMSGLDAAPNYNRAKVTVRSAKEALPDLTVEDTTEWMGHRPALPDTVPVMSPSRKTPGVYYATGHGHLGLTEAATCAKLMGDMITGQKPEIDPAPYSITRF